MYNLYETIKSLCERKGVSVSAMCLNLGMTKSTMSDLKSGRKKSLSSETLTRIADYLCVSVDYLLTGEEKTPAESGERAISYDDFTYAMQNEAAELTEDDKALLLSMARQLNTARKKKESE